MSSKNDMSKANMSAKQDKGREQSDAKNTVRSTPTPWRIGNPEKKSKYGGSLEFKFDIFDVNGDHVLTLTGPKGSERSEEIVRAVNEYDSIRAENTRLRNTHEDLVKALKAVRVLLIDDDLYAQTKELQKTVNEAIASAEGV
jgi:hypothetical protein